MTPRLTDLPFAVEEEETPEQELERLIREQKDDMKLGPYQPPQPHVGFSMDKMVSTQSSTHPDRLGDMVFDQDGRILEGWVSRDRRRWGGCTLHGLTHLRVRTYEGHEDEWYCKQCNVENQRLRRRLRGIKEFKPRSCDHDPSELRVYERTRNGRVNSRTECRACARERDRVRSRARGVKPRGPLLTPEQKRERKRAADKRWREKMKALANERKVR